MFDAIQEDINQVFEPEMSHLQDRVHETFEQIEEDFTSMIRDKKQSASEAPIREKINAWLPSAIKEFESIKRDVEKIRARYPGEA